MIGVAKRNEIGGPARCVPALVVVGTACMVWLLSGGAPGAYAAEAVVTNQLSDSVSFVDLASDKTIAHVKVGGKPAGVALSADRTRAYVTAPETGELIELDTVRRTVSRRLKVSGGPLGVAAHPSRAEVYVADWYAHKIVIVDGTTLTAVAEVTVGQSPSGLAVTPDGTKLVSADRDSNQISIVDLATRTVVAVVPVGARPFGVTISADGATASTANVASNDVSVVDLATRALVGTVKVGHRPYAIAFAGGRGFATDQGIGTITVFDPVNRQPVQTIEACDHPEGIEASADQAHVYVACWGDNVMLKIDAKTLDIAGRIAVGDGPRAFGKFLR